jgi:hypothetical protein
MKLAGNALLAISIVLAGALAADGAQAQSDKPIDLKPLVPPVFRPFPPNSQLRSGAVGGMETPTTTAPLQSPMQTPPQAVPGIKLSIPTR